MAPLPEVDADQILDSGSFERALNDEIDARHEQFEQSGPEASRKKMDGAGRIAKAEACKSEANAQFAAKAWHASLAGYVAGIWYVAHGEPSCPWVVVHPASADDENALAEVPSALGAGVSSADGAAEVALSSELESRADAVRIALHLNVAAAALKVSEWRIARAACEFVLAAQGDAASSKARYRLAMALKGEGRLEEARAVLTRLLELDADNADALKLLGLVSAQQLERVANRLHSSAPTS